MCEPNRSSAHFVARISRTHIDTNPAYHCSRIIHSIIADAEPLLRERDAEKEAAAVPVGTAAVEVAKRFS